MQQNVQNNVVVVKSDGYDYDGTTEGTTGNFFLKITVKLILLSQI